MRLILYAMLLGFTVAQSGQPPDESTLPDSEKRIPAGHYCKRPDVAIGPRETKAHHCGCEYSCSVDAQGNISEHESETCLSYCHANGRRCTCHVEEPCVGKPGNALMDMDGRVIAMKR